MVQYVILGHGYTKCYDRGHVRVDAEIIRDDKKDHDVQDRPEEAYK